MTVLVRKPPFLRYIIDDEFKERVHKQMRRYIPATKSMDLPRFHIDFDLVSNYFCALVWPLVLEVVFNVLSEHMPNLKALNLNGNIWGIDLILRMVKLVALKILSIGENLIRGNEEINAVKDLELQELILTRNPICNEHQFTNDYIKDVQKRCPKLLRLDGIDLRKLVLCDIVYERNNMTSKVCCKSTSAIIYDTIFTKIFPDIR